MRHRHGFTFIEILIVVLIIAIISAIAVPNFMSASERTGRVSCIDNLRLIESAKDQWGFVNKKDPTAVPNKKQLVGTATTGFIKTFPTCPANGVYTIHNLRALPTCTKLSLGHELPPRNP
ncbi:hypothetical protein BH11ARM1_BH11ARM1_16100 [soil metagenome]